MSLADYERRVSLTDYERRVLEELFDGNKNIYQICNEVKKRKKQTPYPTIHRAVKRLEKGMFVKMVGTGVRKSKEYRITPLGMIVLYFAKRGKSDPLDFHRSKDAQKIIDRFIRAFFKNEEEKMKEHVLLKTLRVSPSFAVNAMLFLTYQSKPMVIRNPSLFREIFSRSFSHGEYIHYQQQDENSLHLVFLARAFPLMFLARDFMDYPDDNKIRETLIGALVKGNKATGKRLVEMRTETFNIVFKAIQTGVIDPKRSAREQQKKFEGYVMDKEKECYEKVPWEQWFIYIPPMGEPVLACGN